METIEELTAYILEQQDTILTTQSGSDKAGKLAFENALYAFYKLNLCINVLESNEKKIAFSNTYNKICFLFSSYEFFVYFEWHWYMETMYLLREYNGLGGDYYLFPDAQVQLSEIEFYFEWFPEENTGIRVRDDESKLELDRITAHVAGVMGIEDEKRPLGIPESHWWWFSEKAYEKHQIFREQYPNPWD